MPVDIRKIFEITGYPATREIRDILNEIMINIFFCNKIILFIYDFNRKRQSLLFTWNYSSSGLNKKLFEYMYVYIL